MRAAHEDMFVYQKSLLAVASLYQVAREIRAPSGDLRDQLRRAAFSIPLNIAEGASEFSPAEKQRIYRLARRSAAECLAILDVVDIITESGTQTAEARGRVNEVLALLATTAKAVDRLKSSSSSGSPAGPAP